MLDIISRNKECMFYYGIWMDQPLLCLKSPNTKSSIWTYEPTLNLRCDHSDVHSARGFSMLSVSVPHTPPSPTFLFLIPSTTNHTCAVLHPSLPILPSWSWPQWGGGLSLGVSTAALLLLPSRLFLVTCVSFSSHDFITACALLHVSHKLKKKKKIPPKILF